MALLDAQAPKPKSPFRRVLPLLIILILILAALLTYKFYDFREERAATRFLTVLQQGDYPEAYRLWQPSPSYSYQDFLHDWGPEGDYGKVRTFRLLSSKSKGPESVIVTVRINDVDPPRDLLVDRQTKSLAFSPF
jgi:hypothetical protein